MILDSLENSKRIECIHPLFKQAFDYVKSTDFSKMEDGKYDIADAGFTVSIASLFGKEKPEARHYCIIPPAHNSGSSSGLLSGH